jgi:hypothetical protein
VRVGRDTASTLLPCGVGRLRNLRTRTRALGPDPRDDDAGDPDEREEAGHLAEGEQSDDRREPRLQGHERAERARGESAERDHLEDVRHERQQDCEAEPGQHELPGQERGDARGGDRGGHQPRDRHRHREPHHAGDLVAHTLGEQDVRRPAGCCAEGERHPDHVGRPVPRFGEEQYAEGGHRREEAATAVTSQHRHGEGTEKLQRAGGAHGKSLDGLHEQDRRRGHDDAERDGCGERRPGEGRRPRADQHEHDQARPGQAEPGGPEGPDGVEQPHARSDPQLHGEHRRHRHGDTRCTGPWPQVQLLCSAHAAQYATTPLFAST